MGITAENILELKKINKSFPGVKALSDVDLELRKGEVLALVGENGAGKSTLMKILSGAYKKDSGSIIFDGQEVDIQSPIHSEELGIAIIYQELNLIQRVSVAENIYLGRYPKKNGIVQWQKMYSDSEKLIRELGLDINVKSMLRELSLAQQQLVEIVKAVSTNAKVVIMDEPTSSLSQSETEILFGIIKKLRSKGTSIIFITHRLDEIYEVCDRMSILRDGCYIGSREVKDISKNEMIEMMIGRKLTNQYPVRDTQIGEVVFEVRHLADGDNKVKDVSFQAHAGEVLGFAGLVGAGRTETMRLIFGADKKTSGEILIHGKQTVINNPRDAIKNGIGFVTENRKEEGLFLRSSVKVNTVMVSLKKILKKGLYFDFKKEKEYAEEYVKLLQVATPSVNQRVMFLSGGNQQKVVLAKWLLSDSDIIIFDEPTRGIDVGAKCEIYEIINQLVANGKVVIVVSSDMEEVMGVCDRIIVMHEGVISGEVSKENISQSIIGRLSVGG
ncbi:MAG: sugar ABC transporter ATP-binding protein [Lachnospiraceae bacterium]|nr:sugar ABC transporter ATP-binding protein [Lachnospiraceae bacterium]